MFFSIAWRNAKRSRSENLIYFLTMVTAIATFYIVLSLGEQDVMRFLSELESDAVDRLLTKLLPTVYLCALLFVFSLVIFANKYQLECRSRELGLYLLFGMTKPRLFIQIMAEGLISSLLALLGGLICGGFLSEITDTMDVPTEISALIRKTNPEGPRPDTIKKRINNIGAAKMTIDLLHSRDPDDEILSWLREISAFVNA